MNFTKENLRKGGYGSDYIFFKDDEGVFGLPPFGFGNGPKQFTRKIVASFTPGRKRNMGPFCTFLRKHFTVEEYFARLDAGEKPTDILESKGYISSHSRAGMRKRGFPPTPEGYKAWREFEAKQWAHAQKRIIAFMKTGRNLTWND